MDTRKLKTRTGFSNARDGVGIMDDDMMIADVRGPEKERLAAELVRRWNAFPALVEALRKLHEHAQDTEMDSSEILQGFSAEADAAMENARSLLNTLTQ